MRAEGWCHNRQRETDTIYLPDNEGIGDTTDIMRWGSKHNTTRRNNRTGKIK